MGILKLLGEFSFDGNVVYVSNQEIAIEHFYFPYIIKIENVSLRTEFKYGGVETVERGSISFSTRLWDDSGYKWPPPDNATLTLKSTFSDEAHADTILNNARLVRVSGDNLATDVTYDIFITDILDVDLLKTTLSITARTTTSYEGIETVLPIAVGTVVYAKPLRLNDYSGYPCYYGIGVTGTLHTDWHVYDDGVDICSNVTEGGAGTTGVGTFYLYYSAVGEVSISGNGVFSSGSSMAQSIEALIEFVIGDNIDITSTYARSGDAKIGHYAQSQISLRRYLSLLCASHGHYARFVTESNLELIKIEQAFNTSSTAYTDTKILPISYDVESSKIRSIKMSWPYREQVDEGGRVYVKEETREISRNNSAFWAGTVTSTSSNKLINSGEDFDYNSGYNDSEYLGGDMMRYGMHVRCVDTGDVSTVVSIDSGTQLTLADDIFTSTYGYEIGLSYSTGQDLSLEAYSLDEDTIQRNIKFILNVLHERVCYVSVPYLETTTYEFNYTNGMFCVETSRFERVLNLFYNKIIGVIFNFEKNILIYIVMGTIYEENPLT